MKVVARYCIMVEKSQDGCEVHILTKKGHWGPKAGQNASKEATHPCRNCEMWRRGMVVGFVGRISGGVRSTHSDCTKVGATCECRGYSEQGPNDKIVQPAHMFTRAYSCRRVSYPHCDALCRDKRHGQSHVESSLLNTALILRAAAARRPGRATNQQKACSSIGRPLNNTVEQPSGRVSTTWRGSPFQEQTRACLCRTSIINHLLYIVYRKISPDKWGGSKKTLPSICHRPVPSVKQGGDFTPGNSTPLLHRYSSVRHLILSFCVHASLSAQSTR